MLSILRLFLRPFLHLFLCLGVCAASLPLVAEERLALVGGRLIDGYGHRPVANSVILIKGDTIEAIGSVETLDVPDGYRTVSTEGMDVLPGLWENHAHLMINGHADYPHWQRTYKDRLADEIMPASAVQLLLAGVTSARDMGAPLQASLSVKQRIEDGQIPGPRLFITGPFLQHEVEDWQAHYRWAVHGPDDARAKVRRLAEAGVDAIKLIDQDKMSFDEAQAIVDEAHKHGLPVLAHSHRPDEIRRGLKIGVDNFEHTGLTTAPEYPADVMAMLTERTATGRVAGGPLFWTPTVEGLWNYQHTVNNPEKLDDDCWHRGLQPDTIADIKQSIAEPGHLSYTQLTPLRRPTLKRKVEQLRQAGVVILVGTDSGIPMKFHCQSTWNEMDVLVNVMGMAPMDVIRAATYWPSVMMGVSDQWGSIRPGLKADIIAVDGDVLRHINLLQDVDFVMKGGTVYKQDGQPVEDALTTPKTAAKESSPAQRTE
ncbi:MAG: amidohydrolase family protein [Rhodothalassiaceae bacterium]